MAAIVWMGLLGAWIWHVVDLFCDVDPLELPPRARHWVRGVPAREHPAGLRLVPRT